MLEHNLLVVRQRRLRSDAIPAREWIAVIDIRFQHQGRLRWRQLSGYDSFTAPPTGQGGLAGGAQIAHPVHDAKWGNQIALAVALDRHNRHTARLPALASAYRQNVHRILRFPGTIYLKTRA